MKGNLPQESSHRRLQLQTVLVLLAAQNLLMSVGLARMKMMKMMSDISSGIQRNTSSTLSKSSTMHRKKKSKFDPIIDILQGIRQDAASKDSVTSRAMTAFDNLVAALDPDDHDMLTTVVKLNYKKKFSNIK